VIKGRIGSDVGRIRRKASAGANIPNYTLPTLMGAGHLLNISRLAKGGYHDSASVVTLYIYYRKVLILQETRCLCIILHCRPIIGFLTRGERVPYFLHEEVLRKIEKEWKIDDAATVAKVKAMLYQNLERAFFGFYTRAGLFLFMV
jgi:hypothetical protein